jgi:hypothetical protein
MVGDCGIDPRSARSPPIRRPEIERQSVRLLQTIGIRLISALRKMAIYICLPPD